MPAVLAGLLILAFSRPLSMWVLVPVWMFVAYRLGHVRHIHEEESDAEEQEGSDEDLADSIEEQQSENLPEGGTSTFRH
jgi:fatty acid desaturase